MVLLEWYNGTRTFSKMQGKAAYNKPLCSDPFLDHAHSESLMHRTHYNSIDQSLGSTLILIREKG